MKQLLKLSLAFVLLIFLLGIPGLYSIENYEFNEPPISLENSKFKDISNWKTNHKSEANKDSFNITDTTITNNIQNWDPERPPAVIFFGFDNQIDLPTKSLNDSVNLIQVQIKDQLNISNSKYYSFFKPIDFSCKIRYNWHDKYIKNDSFTIFSGSGTIEIEGTKETEGFCTPNKAVKSIKQIIRKEIEDNITEKVLDNVS